MAKRKYTPFLKLKANEVGAFSTLSDELKATIVLFFDLPFKRGMTTRSFRLMVQKSACKIEKFFGKDRLFFLDDFDIPNSITIGGRPNSEYVIEKFQELSFIPVIGLDRDPTHNDLVFQSSMRSSCLSYPVGPRVSAIVCSVKVNVKLL